MTGSGIINGTGNDLNNYIIGNTANNNLNGGAGNDTLDGGLGNDTLIGGTGNNTLIGGLGSDRLDGNAGIDTASYVNASAAVTVNLALTTAQTGGEATGDVLVKIENLLGSNFNDMLSGNSGNNTLDGGFGNDSLTGGTGNDTYIVDSADDIVTETSTAATEIDTVQSFVRYTLGNNLENLNLIGTGNIDGTGNSLNNTITGNSGNNILTGGLGSDRLDGSLGIDTAAYANASAGVTVNLTLTTAQTGGEATGDILVSIENLFGSNFNDTLIGNSGDNILDGSAGADSLTGGTVTETSTLATEIDTVQTSVSYILNANVENLNLLGTNNINGTGNTLKNNITGNSANNLLNGGGGNDTLTGGAGTDQFLFASGAVFTTTSLGVDTITDFLKGTDKLVLSKTSFNALVSAIGGNLQAAEFAQITATATNELSIAGVSNAKIVYNSGTGNLFYNPDGNVAGLTNGGLFAGITGNPILAASDLLIS